MALAESGRTPLVNVGCGAKSGFGRLVAGCGGCNPAADAAEDGARKPGSRVSTGSTAEVAGSVGLDGPCSGPGDTEGSGDGEPSCLFWDAARLSSRAEAALFKVAMARVLASEFALERPPSAVFEGVCDPVLPGLLESPSALLTCSVLWLVSGCT